MVYGLSLIIHLFPLSRHQQKEHPGSQKQPLDGPGRRREGESRVQHPQSQGIGRAQAAVPQPQGLRQRQGRQGKGEEHPHIEQPGPQAAQQPAAAQGEHQRGRQDHQGRQGQGAPVRPAEQAGIEQGGQGQRRQARTAQHPHMAALARAQPRAGCKGVIGGIPAQLAVALGHGGGSFRSFLAPQRETRPSKNCVPAILRV